MYYIFHNHFEFVVVVNMGILSRNEHFCQIKMRAALFENLSVYCMKYVIMRLYLSIQNQLINNNDEDIGE